MKFVVFWEALPYDSEKRLAKREEIDKEVKQNLEKYPRRMHLQDGTAIIFSMIGQRKGFSLVEADNEEQLQYMASLNAPLLKFKIVPIRQTERAKEK
jgi:hypothetical protein